MRHAIWIILGLLVGCAQPVSDPVKLRRIQAESQSLIARHATRASHAPISVPKSHWPPTIAGLEPHAVTVFNWGLDISVKPYSDGGWGYQVTPGKRDLPMPAKCYSELVDGLYWHGPC